MENLSNIAKQLGSRGGKKSVKKRLGGLTKEQISEHMRGVRLSKLNRAPSEDEKWEDKVERALS